MALVNREIIQAKIEVTYNTDPTPAAGTDDILVQNVSMNNEGLRMVDRPAVRANIGKLQQVHAGMLRKITFDVEMKGAGATYGAAVFPESDPLLRACGLSATLVDTVSWTYQVISTGFESVTIYYFTDGKRYIITGCFGNVSFSHGAGGIGIASFEFIGHSVAPTDVVLPTPTYDSVVPPAVINTTFTTGGFAAIIENLTVDLGNVIATNPSVAAIDGYADLAITGRDVNGSFDPEDELIATDDIEGALRAGTQNTIILGAVGPTTFNKYTFTLLRSYYRDISQGDRDGTRTAEIPFGCDNTSEDEFVLLFN